MLGFQLDWTGEGLSYSSDSVSTTPRLDRYHDHLHVSCNFCGAKVAGRPATGPIHSPLESLFRGPWPIPPCHESGRGEAPPQWRADHHNHVLSSPIASCMNVMNIIIRGRPGYLKRLVWDKMENKI